MQHGEDSNVLRQAGLTELEIYRLERFRQRYTAEQGKRDDAAYLRLKFVRWLVTTGKLTE